MVCVEYKSGSCSPWGSPTMLMSRSLMRSDSVVMTADCGSRRKISRRRITYMLLAPLLVAGSLLHPDPSKLLARPIHKSSSAAATAFAGPKAHECMAQHKRMLPDEDALLTPTTIA